MAVSTGAKCLQISSLLTISTVATPPRAKGQAIVPYYYYTLSKLTTKDKTKKQSWKLP